jgi:hypothetical protein
MPRRLLGTLAALPAWARQWPVARQRVLARAPSRPRWSLSVWVEVGLISALALWVGRQHFNFDNNVWPLGGDWALNVMAYYPWTWLTRCGACVMWHSGLNGGSPAFIDLVTAILHPAVAAAIVLAGVISAAKLTVVMGFLMAGWAQWWLGRSLGFSPLTRVWTAALAITGGHLAGRLAAGLTEELFSSAACALALAAAVDLALTGRRRSVGALGLTAGLAALAGQGYLQIGLLICIFPGLLVFLFTGGLRVRPLLRSFVAAGVLALLVAAVLLVPLGHFWPNFVKPTADLEFQGNQPLGLMLLNLVQADWDFYAQLEQGGLPATPAWHVNYIGWIPVVLALAGLRFVPRRRLLVFLSLGVVLTFLVASAALLRGLAPYIPTVVTTLRTPAVISGLAVPLLLVLAGYSVEALWRAGWPRLVAANGLGHGLSLRWLLLLPLAWSVASALDAGKQWIGVGEGAGMFAEQFSRIDLAGQQWVEPPFGESAFVVLGQESGLKLSNVVRPWGWEGLEYPLARYRLTRDPVHPADPALVRSDNGLNELNYPAVNYAAAILADGRPVACQATSLGGNIDVDCDLPSSGWLQVAEHNWSGWTARRDGQAVALVAGTWLSVPAPAGAHHFQFRYRPWDVPLGLALSALGWAGCLALLFGWHWPRRAARVAARRGG